MAGLRLALCLTHYTLTLHTLHTTHSHSSQMDITPSTPSPSHSCSPLPTFTSSHPSLSPLSPQQEATLISLLTQNSVAVGYSPRANRLARKLKMRQKQRNHGCPTFDLDRHIIDSLSTTVKYVVAREKPYSEQVVPVVQKMAVSLPSPSHLSHPHTYHTILHHLSTFPRLSTSSSAHFSRLTTSLRGCGSDLRPINSPYTSRILKPYIFRSRELRPPQVCPQNPVLNLLLS